MEYFTETADDEGNKTYEATEEVVSKSEFETVNTNLTQIVDKYNNTLKLLEDSKVSINEEEEIVIEDEATTIDMKKIVTDIKNEIMQEINSEIKKKQEVEVKLQKLMEDHKLPDEYLTILQNSSTPENVAPILGRERLKFIDTKGSSGDNDDELDTILGSFMADIDKQLGRRVAK